MSVYTNTRDQENGVLVPDQLRARETRNGPTCTPGFTRGDIAPGRALYEDYGN